MGGLSARAQGWVCGVVLAGCVALCLGLLQVHALELDAPIFWVLLIGACLGHAFPVIAPRHQAYHGTQAFLMAAVLLLSWPAVVLIVLAAHLTEWLRRPRPAYIQLYNVAVYLLASGAALFVLDRLGARPFSFADARIIVAAFVAALVLLLVNHALTAAALWLARGIRPAESGLFGRDSLGLDGSLLVVGIGMAGAWQVQPLAIVATGSPLILIYRGLQLASAESASHRDQLTGLYNSRHFLEALEFELRRARAATHPAPTGMLVVVVDDVPALIQRYGRASLDFLVVALGQRLERVLRDFDVLARLDEDTLGVLLPELDADQARQVAERIDSAITARAIALPTTRQPVVASASLVIASIPAADTDAADVIASLRQAGARAALSGPRAILTLDSVSPPHAAATQAMLPSQVAAASVDTARPWVPPRRWLRIFQVAVIAVGVAASIAAVATSPLPDWPLAVGVLGLVVLSELLAFDLFDRSSFSVSFAPIVAAGLLGGPATTLVATWSVALVRGGLRRSAWHRVAFNGSVFSLMGLLATLAATGAGRLSLGAGQLAPLVISVAIASSIYYLHTYLVAMAIALDLGADPREVWARNYRWLFPHYIVLGWMGLGLAVATLELGPLGTALFLAPPLAMRFVLKQYTDRTSGAVQRLELVNAELRGASTLLQRRGDELSLLSDLGQLVVSEPGGESLPARVAARCVPALGDLCAVLWLTPNGPQRALHGSDAAPVAATLRELETYSPDALHELAEEAEQGRTPPVAGSSDGTWLVEPLVGVDHALGCLLTWSEQRLDDAERARRQALMREVAQRVALALDRDALLEEAAELDALRAIDRVKSDFIATTAHELRTPLTSLQGYTELLRNSVEPELRDRWLGIVHVEAAQLGQVVDQLLDVSRLDSGRFQAVRTAFELRDVVSDIVDHFAQQATLSQHELSAEVADVPTVYADASQIERVLRNLVSNALKYSPGGGPVRISAGERSAAEVEVCVEDRGLGIPPDWLDRLFERFQRIERPERASIRGTGLGLYIARQLVELNDGRIWVTSEGVRHGSMFHFTVPRAIVRK